ncbi:MAG: hypothetical protein KDB35_05430, partial [Acidimicrobiales bacterium]|nr:hypothetical protein [Acidimicrobiales bacterium]MCB1017899.1 hypothetical protein [Acidimicrobiales bacterium]
ADTTRLVGRAEADAEAARLDAYRDLEQATVLGLALRELAGSLPNLTTLTLTPDLLTPLLTRLAPTGEDGDGTGGATREAA